MYKSENVCGAYRTMIKVNEKKKARDLTHKLFGNHLGHCFKTVGMVVPAQM